MSIAIINQLRHVRMPPTEKLVLVMMATYAGEDGCNAYPSVATLADHCGLSVRAVQKVLRRLERTGHLVVHELSRQHRATNYRVIVTPEVNQRSPLASVEQEFRGEPTFTPDAPEVNQRSPLASVASLQSTGLASPGVNFTTLRGELEHCSGVNPGSPDPSVDPPRRKAVPRPRHRHTFQKQPRAAETPTDNVRVIVKIVHDLLDLQAFGSKGDLEEAVKSQCAHHRISYNSEAVTRSVESAQFQRQARRAAGVVA